MTLNVEQLRSFDSNWGNLVVQNGQNGAAQVKSGGFLHALGSFFGTTAAKINRARSPRLKLKEFASEKNISVIPYRG